MPANPDKYPPYPTDAMAAHPTTCDETDPWERMPGESLIAYACFKIYRDAGIKRALWRSSQYLAEKFGREYKRGNRGGAGGEVCHRVRKWADEFIWFDRAIAYEDFLDRLALDERIEAVKDMNRRHIETSITIQRIVNDSLVILAENVHKLKPRDLIAFFLGAVKVERDARGANLDELTSKMKEEFGDGRQALDGPVEARTEDQREQMAAAGREFMVRVQQISRGEKIKGVEG